MARQEYPEAHSRFCRHLRHGRIMPIWDAWNLEEMVPSCSAALYYPKYFILPVYDLKRKIRFHFFQKSSPLPFLGGTRVKRLLFGVEYILFYFIFSDCGKLLLTLGCRCSEMQLLRSYVKTIRNYLAFYCRKKKSRPSSLAKQGNQNVLGSTQICQSHLTSR